MVLQKRGWGMLTRSGVQTPGRLLFLVLALVPLSVGQTTRMVHGLVTDAHGRAVDRAVVQMKDTRSLLVRSFITGTDGKFHFANISRDIDYEFSAASEGIRSHTHTLSKFNS